MAEYPEDVEHDEDCTCDECAQEEAKEVEAEEKRIRGNRALAYSQMDPGKVAATVKALRGPNRPPAHGSVEGHGYVSGPLERDGVKLFDDGY